MAQRITLTLAPELLEGVKAAKPKALSLASFCALLVEEGLSRQAPELSADAPEPGLASGLTLR
jgi:hypothetical protein